IIGRLIIGFNCGLNSGFVPMYLTEVSPINLRGTLGSVHQLVVTIAILISQIIGLPYLMGNERWWPLILALTALPALFQVVTLPFCPESPKYSLIVKNRVEQAEKDLKKLRGRENVQEELDVMHEEAHAIKSVAKVSMSDMFTVPALRWPMTIAIVMMLSQQLSGINAAMFYSTVIFRGAGLTGLAPFYATIGMGAVNVLMTIVSVYLVDHPRFGRRSLHLAGLGGMWLSSILIVVCLSISEMGKTEPTGESKYQWASYMAIFFVLTFVVSFATGPGSIPWFYVSEIFASGSRGNANSIAVMVNWTANFVVSVSFLPLNNAVGQFSFLLFVFFLTLCWLFTFKFVPETKGRTVEEIVQSFEERARKNN
uniref:Major facilitator superfamily (MFS) profile domain-containing protein n=1 Tax=Plectus sambesii TaxID=2011161 RepID=A0A914UIY0_9BILA